MPRKVTSSFQRKISPDRKYQSILIQRLINKSMLNGKKHIAERAVYANLMRLVPPERAGRVRNPYREWAGALVRADLFGWVRPGLPDQAARLAWADARLSHTRNGVYGALWVAALGSWAMVGTDVGEVLDVAGECVPPGSALAAAIAEGRGAAGLGLARGLDRLHSLYGDLHRVHVLNNAATIAFALQLGRGDFTTSVGAAVTAGWDTEVGACVGGVVGALAGADGIGANWTKPLAGRIATSLPGGERSIDELAHRTLLQAR